jgi:hypothetical protein
MEEEVFMDSLSRDLIKHCLDDLSSNEFTAGKHHISGIGYFWSHAKMRILKFRL